MKKYDIVILTEDRYDNIVASDSNERNILLEDSIIQESLEKLGLKVLRTSWANPNFDWATTKAALFSTTWDYFDRFPEFSKWLEKTKHKTKFINPYETLKWNLDKHYLLDLQNAEINIPPTVFVEIGNKSSLKEIFEQTNWKEAVLKPSVSGAGRHTYRIHKENLADYENIFTELIENESMMLQEFQYNIVEKGEVAYMIMGDKFTHAILKKAKKGDFRVQDDFGGSVEVYNPTQEEIDFALRTVKNCGKKTIYARVDIFYDNNNQPAIGELELIEPELWYRFNSNAANDLAKMISNFIS